MSANESIARVDRRAGDAPATMFDPSDPDTAVQPYDKMAGLRAQCPVLHGNAGWYVSRYSDVKDVAISEQLGRNHPDGPHAMFAWFDDAAMTASRRQVLDGSFLRDGASLTLWRKIIGPYLTPRFLESFEPTVRRIFETLMRTAKNETRFDIMAQVFIQLPHQVVSEFLGVPKDDQASLARYAASGAARVTVAPTAEALSEMEEGFDFLWNYFARLVADRSTGTPVMEAFKAAVRDETLTPSEAAALASDLYLGGAITSGLALGNVLHALLVHRKQWELLCNDPGLSTSCFEEGLRYDSPSQTFFRRAFEDIGIGDAIVKEGSFVIGLPGSANRDSATYAAPDIFDIRRFLDRSTPRPMTFGGGLHACPGSALARLEGRVALKHLSQEFPSLRLAPEGGRRAEQFNTRGFAELWVELG